jgi:hypothetical protein
MTHVILLKHLACNNMKTTIVSLIIAIVLISHSLSAQKGLNTNAFLREVSHLNRVNEPKGGLVPYRVGMMLAYADTSGNLVIGPFGRWQGIRDTRFFQQGFVVIHPFLSKVIPLTGNLSRQREPVRLAILNTRGEILLVRRSEAAIFQPDGSLLCVPHWQAHGQPELLELTKDNFGRNNCFDSWVSAPTLAFYDQAPAQSTNLTLPDTLTWDSALPYAEWLSVRRVARRINFNSKETQSQLLWRTALGDWHGRTLTPYQYAEIDRFREGIAVAELPLAPARAKVASRGQEARIYRSQYTYLDTVGQPITSRLFDVAGPFRHGRAVVCLGERMGVIDRMGNFVVPISKRLVFGPDQEGYIVLADKRDDKHSNSVQLFAPVGKPRIPQVFASARGFWQGRAEVTLGERAGLIDTSGLWVTPLSYEVLRTPNELRSNIEGSDQYVPRQGEPEPFNNNIIQPFLRPDSTLLVGRRIGKIGLISRKTGQELVAARYDTIVLNPCHGMACLRRGGIDYLVSSFNGQEVAATYQGFEFITAYGRRILVTRRSPASWALADTLAQLRTPWILGTGYLTPYGHLLSLKRDSAILYSQEGKILLRAEGITTQLWGSIWNDIGGHDWYRAHASDEPRNAHYQIPLVNHYPSAHGVYFAQNRSKQSLSIYDSQVHKLTSLFLPPRESNQQLILLNSGWSTLIEYVGEGSSRKAVVKNIFTDVGQPIPPAPLGAKWTLDIWEDYPKMWQVYGLLPTTDGYVTRGKRQLWQN